MIAEAKHPGIILDDAALLDVLTVAEACGGLLRHTGRFRDVGPWKWRLAHKAHS